MIRIACSAVCKRIRAGRVNKAGNSFIGDPADVTGDFLKAVVDYFDDGKPRKIFVNGAEAYEVTVRALKSQQDAAIESKPAEQSANMWISVDERLPEPGAAVLIAFADGGVDLSFRYVMKNTGAHVCWEGVEFEHHASPTHWQPLPAPPA